MEAKELRIGNLIKFISTDDIDVVLDINTRIIKKPSINNVNITDVEPILLTEEWLLRFGYTGSIESNFFEKESLISNAFKKHVIWIPFKVFLDNEYGFKIKYVHQLQNLYFDLTGEELTISN